MSRLWKNFRTNLMYWRFRNITRNRLRVQSWWARRRGPTTQYRARGSASMIYYHSSRRSWVALSILVVLLTALKVTALYVFINPTLVYLLGVVIVIGVIYGTLRGL
jgi:hypothetical protein